MSQYKRKKGDTPTHPFCRIIKPEDVANIVPFMKSEALFSNSYLEAREDRQGRPIFILGWADDPASTEGRWEKSAIVWIGMRDCYLGSPFCQLVEEEIVKGLEVSGALRRQMMEDSGARKDDAKAIGEVLEGALDDGMARGV